MAKPRQPTLTQSQGERPRCQYCGKDLKPLKCTVEVADHITKVPSNHELLGMPQPNPRGSTTGMTRKQTYRPAFRICASAFLGTLATTLTRGSTTSAISYRMAVPSTDATSDGFSLCLSSSHRAISVVAS